jgi:predicted nucleic-acid-binding protein
MYRAARASVERAEAEGLPLKVHPVHIAEAVYALEGWVYGLSPRVASEELLILLSAEVLSVQDELPVMRALQRYPDAGVDFADVLLAELARIGADDVLSFDNCIQRLGVRVVSPS